MKDLIHTLEEKLRIAMLTSDTKTLDVLLSDTLIFTNHLGQVMSKVDDMIGHTTGAVDIEELDIGKTDIRVHGNTAIVSASARIAGTFNQKPASGNFRFTRVWLNDKNAWRVVAGHASLLNEG